MYVYVWLGVPFGTEPSWSPVGAQLEPSLVLRAQWACILVYRQSITIDFWINYDPSYKTFSVLQYKYRVRELQYPGLETKISLVLILY